DGVGGQVRDLGVVRQVHHVDRRLAGVDRGDDGGDLLPRPIARDGALASNLRLDVGTVITLPALAVFDRSERNLVGGAVAGRLGQEVGKELRQVTVAGGR